MFQDSESGRYECEFEVRNVIKPEELEDRDTEVFSILEHGNTARSIQAVRDHIKIKKEIHGVRCVEPVMLGMESQEHNHYAKSCLLLFCGTYLA